MANRIFFSLFIYLFIQQTASSQSILCAKLDSLKAQGQIKTAKRFIFAQLSKSTLPKEDCFYQNGLSLFEENKHFSLDSVEKVYRVWQTVSTKPCVPMTAYLEVMRLNYSPTTQEAYCNVFKELYGSCQRGKIPTDLKPYGLLCPSLTCQDVDSIYKTEKASLSLEQAKQLLSLLSQKECTTSDLYTHAHLLILEKEPSFAGLFQQALNYKNKGNLTESQHFFTKAEKLARTPEQKANCYLGIAETFQLQKNYGKAKDFASFAAETDTKNPQSFLFLANLYQLAETECGFKLEEEKRALYAQIASCYDKGGDAKAAASYNERSKRNSGDTTVSPKTIQLRCFINENVTLTK